jgi:hypothetical protein
LPSFDSRRRRFHYRSKAIIAPVKPPFLKLLELGQIIASVVGVSSSRAMFVRRLRPADALQYRRLRLLAIEAPSFLDVASSA